MRAGLLLSAALAFASLGFVIAAEPEPLADARATVTVGQARFTVLTDRLIRLEWSADGTFEDRATLAVVNRRLTVPEFTVVRDGAGVCIDTGRVRLEYRGGKFSADSLSATFDGGSWHYGQPDRGNLCGTYPTLDGFDGDRNVGHKTTTPLEKGVVSRDGWAVVDESERHVFNRVNGHFKNWIAAREPGERKDLYLFAYGHDYRAAVADYIRIAGKIPLPPRWAFGYWWSRYWTYSDREIRELVESMEHASVPVDVVIVDMDWHQTWGCEGDCEFGGWCNGWTGYSWNRSLFPEPKNLFGYLHRHGCASALNIHPASGIKPVEECYKAFAADYGWDKTNAIPYRLDEEKWADCWFRHALGPCEEAGIDFWWIDWQQWPTSRWTPGLSNIFLLNHVMNRHMEELGRRPLIYHRWGGLGSHRYQVGFSGDTYATWATLAYLPHFTATAGNVGYGYWGHDIGGFVQREDHTDGELYTRWLQYGVFTPIFKTHSTKNNRIERRFWKFPEHQEYMRAAVQLRYRLAPYLYSAARQAYDTGLSVCRPLYWYWPEEDAVYDPTLTEHLFGDDILAFAVASPADKTSGLAEVRLWIPEGRWYDAATGDFYEGPAMRTNRYEIGEAPYLVKAGAILPMNPDGLRNLKTTPATLVFTCVPGAANGATRVYEDDGTGADYETACAWTPAKVERDDVKTVVTIGPRAGRYAGAPARRNYVLRFPGDVPPKTVTVNGRPLAYARFGGQDTWTYDGYTLETTVETADFACGETVTVELTFDAKNVALRPKLAGLMGRFQREARACERFKVEYESRKPEAKDWRMYEDRLRRAGLPSALTEHPERLAEILNETL